MDVALILRLLGMGSAFYLDAKKAVRDAGGVNGVLGPVKEYWKARLAQLEQEISAKNRRVETDKVQSGVKLSKL